LATRRTAHLRERILDRFARARERPVLEGDRREQSGLGGDSAGLPHAEFVHACASFRLALAEVRLACETPENPRFTPGLPRQEVGGRRVGMTNALREELFKLSAAERLELVEELWDSIADEHEALALTDEQREDLERRLAEADADPSGGSPWEDVRERIRHRSR